MNKNTKTTILIKTDKKVKTAAERALKKAGIPLSTYLNIQLRKVAEPGIVVVAGPVPNRRTARALDAGLKEFREGKTAGPFGTVDELFESLNN